MIHIYCGDGKGKTSAAIGLAVRAAGRKKKIVIARFLKTEDSGEVEILRGIDGITVIPCEKTFGFVFSMDEATRKEAAAYYLSLFLRAAEMAKENDVLILDEIMAAISYDMVPEDMVCRFLKDKPKTLEVILTGRNPGERLLDLADYVSEITKRKHPYDRGIRAREGIEY